jgi:hypothetical protein
MTELSSLEQVVLFSLGLPEDDGAFLGSLLAAIEGEYQETRRDYYIAGLPLPTDAELRDTLQRLRDRDYIEATGCGGTTVGDLRDTEIDKWETRLFATPSGLEAASEFRRLVQSDKGRRMTGEFVRRYIEEQREYLPFQPVVPSWMLADESLLNALEVGDDDPFHLMYRRGPDWIVLEQSLEEIPGEFVGPTTEPLSARSETYRSVELSIREYQLTSIWARLVINWKHGRLSCRVVIDRNYDVGAYPEWRPAEIDDALREEGISIARSVIEHVEK